MPSVVPGYAYDIFISYRQNDNQSGWVTAFVQRLNEELAATFKEPVSVYFDINPHDGLHEHHQVDDSLKQKLKCLVLIPIVSRTFCDTTSFAWKNEFKVFIEQARADQFGLKVSVAGGNVANRVLPIRIHELESEDIRLFESEIEGVMRPIDFIYKESGVNRPLLDTHDRKDNLAHTDYGNQINKVANAIREIITNLKSTDHNKEARKDLSLDAPERKKIEIVKEFKQRNVLRAGLMYVIVGLLLWKIADIITDLLALSKIIVSVVLLVVVVGFPIAVALAWMYERSPGGFVRIGSEASLENPFSRYEKKPLTSNAFMLVLFGTLLTLFFIFPKAIFRSSAGMEASQASVAVLPFINNTGSTDLDFYGMGLASEIRTQLAVAKQFDFISSMQATAAYKNSGEAPKMIGDKLGVTHLVSGMYQGKEDNLQVIVELVEIASGKIIWTIPYKTQAADFFSLQASIAEKVLQKFNSENVARNAPTFSMEAFAEYSLGLEASLTTNVAEIRLQSNKRFENAIRLDSGLLAAWSGLVGNYSYHYFNLPNDTAVTRQMITPLMRYIESHFEDSWEKNEAKGIYAYWVERDYEKGMKLFLEVLKANPESDWANSLLSAIYRRKMLYKDALKYRVKATKQHNAPSDWRELGHIFLNNGDYENAEKAYRNAFELNANIFIELYLIKKNQGELEDLPEGVKQRCGNTYKADLYLQRRDYKSLLKFTNEVVLDSTFNELSRPYYQAEAYLAMSLEDSARKAAENYFRARAIMPQLRLVSQGAFIGKDAAIGGILGQEVDMKKIFPFPDEQIEQDLLLQRNIQYTELEHLVFQKEFEKATAKLVHMNREFPLYGNYVWLNLPMYDRIKKEYPRFQEAINGLKIPPKVSETDRLKM